MKKIAFQPIGTCEEIAGDGLGKQMKVILSSELKRGLHNLKHFSHCVIFTKTDDKLHSHSCRILDIHERSGEMRIAAAGTPERVEGELVDIKPFFPCEEVVEPHQEQQGRGQESFAPLAFTGSPIGEYRFVQHHGRIQFQETEGLHASQLSEAIGGIQPGDYLRIIWWFHRFDDKKYRSHVMCNPPYDNAPECGVFATRSPVRPNPLASTLVKVVEADPQHHWISVLGFDGFEHSVVLQVMPYREEYPEDAEVPEWVSHWTRYKVFHDHTENQMLADDDTTNQMMTAFDAGKNQVLTEDGEVPADAEDGWCEELDEDETIEQEAYKSNEIVVENASIHNLKGITVRIPKEEITVIIGVSGSGKSSLAFDTIHHESQKQFIDLVASNSPIGTDLKDSKVKRITGLQPSIAIEQKNLGANPRSTVASVTRIGEYLRLLYATIGERFCPACGQTVPDNNVCTGCGTIFFAMTPALFNYNHPEYMCPVCKGLGDEYQFDIDLIVPRQDLSILDGASDWWGNLRKHREKPNANWMKGEVLALAEEMHEDLEAPYHALSDGFKQQVLYGSSGRAVTLQFENPNGRSGTITRPVEGVLNILNRLLTENRSDKAMDHIERYMARKKCSRCHGERLLEEGRLVRIGNTRYPAATLMSISELGKWCRATYRRLSPVERETCRPIFSKIVSRLKKLEQVGLGYLNLDRSIPSLSGGEAQRLKIATQFGTGLSNILYIMDEPSKGLHPKDYHFLIGAIQELKKQQNTIIIVEHKKAFEQMADYLIEMGPGAGHYGGQLMRAERTTRAVRPSAPGAHPDASDGLVVVRDEEGPHQRLVLKGARTNNLKNLDVSMPLSSFICVIGVSGSGKSSLVSKTLYPAVMRKLGGRTDLTPDFDGLQGIEHINDVYYVSQKAIGKNARSNPGTYTGVFDLIRVLYAGLPDAKKARLTKEHFSFNSIKGQCPECKGAGEIAIPMHFMPDLTIPCSKCSGQRYREEVLQIKYKGFSIADLLDMEIGEVRDIVATESGICRILDMLCKVGLSYMKLGQSAATLSGGEAQRIKLAKELCDGKAKGTLYILDEPTTGLHDDDVKKLCDILNELTIKGATVIVIEHHPLLVGQADYLIEMGPEGGDRGGYVTRAGWLRKQGE